MTIAAYGRFTEAGIKRIATAQGRSPFSVERCVDDVPPAIKPIRLPREELKRIIDLVARMHGATFDEVMSNRKPNRIAHARQAAMCAVRAARPDMTPPQIGRLFNREETTVRSSLELRGFR